MSQTYQFVQDFRKIVEHFELREDGLYYKKEKRELLLKWSAFSFVRLRYFPGRIKTNQYECLIKVNNGMNLRISSVTFEGFGNFKDQVDDYAEFVRALIERIWKENPETEIQFGHFASRFTFGLISQLLIFGTLGWGVFTLPIGGASV